jgi:hypothetical protein
MGHKFSVRCGLVGNERKETAPVFTQVGIVRNNTFQPIGTSRTLDPHAPLAAPPQVVASELR